MNPPIVEKRRPAWRHILAILTLTFGLLLPAFLATPAAATHNWDVFVPVKCGLAGGSGDLITHVYIDYSVSKASSRVDRVKIENTSARWVDTNVAFESSADGGVHVEKNFNFAPGASLTFEITHNLWSHKQYYPWLTVNGTATGGKVRHNFDLNYYPEKHCWTWET